MTTVLDPRSVEPLREPHLTPVIKSLEGELREDYAPPNVKRHAHPKMHGFVQAVLRVDDPVPLEMDDLRYGIFGTAEPRREYPAWVRFSNAFGIQHDLKFESRGMAIKILGAEGPRLLADQEPFSFETDTQDFVLAVHDAFPLPNTTQLDYAKFSKAARAGIGPIVKLFTRERLFRGLIALIRGGLAPARNPVALTYFSQTAYRLGPHKVKVQARPVFTPELRRALPNVVWFFLKMAAATVILALGESGGIRWLLDFVGLGGTTEAAELFVDRHLGSKHSMRHALSAFLASHAAHFEILVQKQTDPDRMPDDDPTVRWKQSLSPFVRVATLTIPRQVFWPAPGMPETILRATIDMVDLGEKTSFSPWHSLEAHEPLGEINRARGRIYKELSIFRHQENGVKPHRNGGESACLRSEYTRLKKIVRGGLMEGRRERT
jgi:hypothetical protein